MSISIWGTTSEWAGSGPHVRKFLEGEQCCRGYDLTSFPTMISDRDDNQLLSVWLCPKCSSVWFKKPGINQFFSIKPVMKDPFRQNREG